MWNQLLIQTLEERCFGKVNNKFAFFRKSNIKIFIYSSIQTKDENSVEKQSTDEKAKVQVKEPLKESQKQPVKDESILKENTPAKRRSSLIPAKSNRASELRRRASIVRSMSVSDDLRQPQFFTPKKPIPSTTMVKSVNALMRSECLEKDASQSKSLAKKFPHIIGNLNLFNEVTNEMKMNGPNAYLLNKFGATNSPKRTPKNTKPKRLSLRSEVRVVSNCQDLIFSKFYIDISGERNENPEGEQR